VGRLFLRSLTRKERKILVLVCAGFTLMLGSPNALSTTEQVVKNRMRGILHKAGSHTRCELILFIFRNGVVECPCTQRSQSSAN
jgi:DNA-binding NarL/FixJ family response regulator